MSPTLLALVVVVGVLLAGVGYWLVQSSGAGADERPPIVAQTDAHGRSRIIDRYVYLALELCRIDGAIDETEIAAIEAGLTEGLVGMPREDASRMVHQALRATIRQAQVATALEEVAKHADREHRDWVLAKLTAIADADGTVNPEEKRFLDRVRAALR